MCSINYLYQSNQFSTKKNQFSFLIWLILRESRKFMWQISNNKSTWARSAHLTQKAKVEWIFWILSGMDLISTRLYFSTTKPLIQKISWLISSFSFWYLLVTKPFFFMISFKIFVTLNNINNIQGVQSLR